MIFFIKESIVIIRMQMNIIENISESLKSFPAMYHFKQSFSFTWLIFYRLPDILVLMLSKLIHAISSLS